ncbi:hypothetical protein D3C81_1088810 [compost metagenome]
MLKLWIFAGKSDKRDLLLYLCKLLTASDHRVLLVDITDFRKYRYTIGSTATELPLMQFSGFDVSDGLPDLAQTTYDYVLYDVESLHIGLNVWESADQIVWVTSFDRYEVESSAEWFRLLLTRWPQLNNIEVLPVYVRTVDSFLTSEYIMSFMEGISINWSHDEIWIPWNETNVAVQIENEHAQLLRMRGISRSYKRALRHLMEQLTGWGTAKTRRALRVVERRRA